jgi:hypothetical protein
MPGTSVIAPVELVMAKQNALLYIPRKAYFAYNYNNALHNKGTIANQRLRTGKPRRVFYPYFRRLGPHEIPAAIAVLSVSPLSGIPWTPSTASAKQTTNLDLPLAPIRWAAHK